MKISPIKLLVAVAGAIVFGILLWFAWKPVLIAIGILAAVVAIAALIIFGGRGGIRFRGFGQLLPALLVIAALAWIYTSFRSWQAVREAKAHSVPALSDVPDTGRVLVVATKFGSQKYKRPDGRLLSWEVLNDGGCTYTVRYEPEDEPGVVRSQLFEKTYELRSLPLPRWLEFVAGDDCQVAKFHLWVVQRPVRL